MKIQKSDSNILQYFKQISIAVLFIGAAIFFYACESDIEKIKAFSLTDTLPESEAVNFESLFTDSGQVRFFLKAPKLLRFENEGKAYIEFPEGMELVRYDDNNRITSGITANYAKQIEKEQKWEAKNNVIATNANGDTLKTEHLIWEEQSEKIYTDEFVKIIRADQIITGIGFTSDQSLENWKIKNPKGIIYVTIGGEGNPQDSIDSSPDPVRPLNQTDKSPLQFKK